MTPSTQNRVLLLLLGALCIVGIVDGAVSGDPDVVILFALTALGIAMLALRVSWHRPAVPIRADLVRWMEQRAIEGGETVDAVADRAIAAHRRGLSPHRTDD